MYEVYALGTAMKTSLKRTAAAAALLGAIGAPALAAQPPQPGAAEASSQFVLPRYGTINPFYGTINPFYGTINPFYGDISPFWGDISPFWGTINPFYGDINAFWGDISPFYGTINPFWGDISPFYGDINAFWGDINAFWGDIGPFWGDINAFWGDINAFTDADYAKLAGDIDTVFAEAEAVFGPAVKASTGLSIEEAFLAELKARYGLDTRDPASLAELDAQDRAAFFLEFYDHLMGFTGADRVDHWMPSIGWTPQLAQSVGGGAGVSVGLLDFSFGAALDGHYRASFGERDYLNFNHGQAVASLIGADMDGEGVMGVAPGASMWLYNPFDETLTASWEDVTWGLRRLSQIDTDVVNLSLGVPGWTLHPEWARVLSSANLKRHSEDILFVFAAGNDGMSQTIDVDWSDVGEVENLLIVGSINPAGEISSFSNRPGEACLTVGGACGEGQRLMDRFLVAPGELILVPDGEGGVVRMSGTSFSAPLVTGAAALVKGRWNWLEPGDVADVLLRSARDLGDPGVDAVYGRGALDVAASLRPFSMDTLYHIGGDGSVSGTGEFGFVNGQVLASVEGEFVTLFEDFRGTFRDFQVAVEDVNFTDDDSAGTNDDAQEYIEDQTRGNGNGRGKGRNKFAFAPDVAQVIARSGDVTVTRFASRLDVGERAADGDLPFQAGFVIENAARGRALRFGHGEGALAFSSGAGFGRAADHRASTGGVNPVLGFASGGAYAAGETRLGDTLELALVMTSKRDAYRFADPITGEHTNLFTSLDAYSASALGAALRAEVRDGLSLTAGYTRLDEADALLGAQGLGDFAFTDTATDALTIGGEARLTRSLTLAGSATAGRTRAAGEGASALRLSEAMNSTAFQFSLRRDGVFAATDAVRFSLIQPLHVETGAVEYTSSVVTDRDTGALGPQTRRWALSGERALAAELLYAGSIFDGRAGFSAFTRIEAPEARFAGGEAEIAGGLRIDLDF
ncbi:MAG: S8 family peptidase [Oceanicaulis sp.]